MLCAYLRMPYIPPGEPPADDVGETVLGVHRERVQERVVRLAAQRVLTVNLRTEHVDRTYLAAAVWETIDLDLRAATLIDFDLSGCTVRMALFTSATFVGPADFLQVTFTGPAGFRSAEFAAPAYFHQATFLDRSEFTSATFADLAEFNDSTFAKSTSFTRASFVKGVPPEAAQVLENERRQSKALFADPDDTDG